MARDKAAPNRITDPPLTPPPSSFTRPSVMRGCQASHISFWVILKDAISRSAVIAATQFSSLHANCTDLAVLSISRVCLGQIRAAGSERTPQQTTVKLWGDQVVGRERGQRAESVIVGTNIRWGSASSGLERGRDIQCVVANYLCFICIFLSNG